MLRSLFAKTVRDRRRALAWWTVGISAYILFMDAFWPFVRDQQEQLRSIVEAVPLELRTVFGVRSVESLFSPEGYLSSRSLVPVVLSVYAAALGARAVAGEEEANTIDLLLSGPLSRTRLVLEQFAALSACMAYLGGVLFGALLVGEALWDLGIDPGRYLAACLSATLLGLVFGSLALAAGAAGASRGLALGLVAGAAAATLVDSLGTVVDRLAAVRKLSPFYYYGSSQPLANGLDAGHALLLAGVVGVAVLVAVDGFRSRDVGV